MFTTYVIAPIYNVFVFLIGVMPGGDVGLAIVALTLLMRIVLYPVFSSSIRTQMGMQAMQAELDEAKPRLKDKPQELGKLQLELARKYKVNPLAMLGSLVVQFGLIIALYYALFREGFPAINTALLYPFVHAPSVVATNFFNLLDLLTPHHIVLAALIGATQYAAIRLTLKRTPPPVGASADKLAAHRMQQQMMRYLMPVLLTVLGFVFPGAVGLYFLTGNVVSIAQEWLIRRELAARA